MHIHTPSDQIKVLNYAHNAAVTGAPRFLLIGGRPVYAPSNSLANVTAGYVIEAQINRVPKSEGDEWDLFEPVYWDNTNAVWTSESSGNTLGGLAAAFAEEVDVLGNIFLLSLNP